MDIKGTMTSLASPASPVYLGIFIRRCIVHSDLRILKKSGEAVLPPSSSPTYATTSPLRDREGGGGREGGGERDFQEGRQEGRGSVSAEVK
jgi:hypothetical protein